VAFTFNCLFFGALAFRQISDNIKLKEHNHGEDRRLLLDPKSMIIVLTTMFLALVIGALFLQIENPAVFHYAFPLIIASQALQMGLRVWFQRTRVTTRAIVVRAVLSDAVHIAPYNNILAIVVHDERMWVNISVLLPTEEIRFRIFRKNRGNLINILESACAVPLMYAGQISDKRATRHSTK
jgi:hypothetical protein